MVRTDTPADQIPGAIQSVGTVDSDQLVCNENDSQHTFSRSVVLRYDLKIKMVAALTIYDYYVLLSTE